MRSEREDGITISQEPAPVTPESASSPKRMLPGLLGPDGMPIADEPDAAVLAAEGDGEQRKDERSALCLRACVIACLIERSIDS